MVKPPQESEERYNKARLTLCESKLKCLHQPNHLLLLYIDVCLYTGGRDISAVENEVVKIPT